MSRLDEINRVLRKLQSDSFGVEACALISEDGLMIASVLAADMEETRVAGMTATLLSLGGRAAMELGRSHLQEVIIRGESGYAVLVSAGRGALLLTAGAFNLALWLFGALMTLFGMLGSLKSITERATQSAIDRGKRRRLRQAQAAAARPELVAAASCG